MIVLQLSCLHRSTKKREEPQLKNCQDRSTLFIPQSSPKVRLQFSEKLQKVKSYMSDSTGLSMVVTAAVADDDDDNK